MNSVILDASAILAFIQREPGSEIVAQHLSAAMVSAVNFAEVGARLSDWGIEDDEIRNAIKDLGIQIASFDEDMAYASTTLRPLTRRLGLSLGDRACLALARSVGLPALTADRAWGDLDIGVEIRLIRE